MKKVSVIIPSFNRYKFLINAIRSVESQSHKNIEIIVIDDGSTEKEYKNLETEDIRVIHSENNSRELFGFANINYVRNIGISASTGDYIAFLDDDDIWFPKKLELQLRAMTETGCKMSCSDGFIGIGEFDSKQEYKLYLQEHYYDIVFSKYKENNASHFFNNGHYPSVWTRKFIQIHNCITTCSVLVDRKVIDQAGLMPDSPPPGEDYHYWLKLLEIGNFTYIEEPCFYCDKGHGYGRKYD